MSLTKKLGPILVVLILLCSGCSNESSEPALSNSVGWLDSQDDAFILAKNPDSYDIAFTLTEEDSGAVVQVNSGTVFKVVLVSNITTGFSWTFETPFDTPPLKLLDQYYLDPDSGLPGAAGTQHWIFQAYSKGTTYIDLVYWRIWDPYSAIAWMDYTIVVRPGQ
ncbi:MAG: protease inhibitor I42 family protein [Candidatus Zixiibacteriota bacterium]|nr:MAG: protease inhibitor I42 family protein [candidate division Zixibacteria bacterium]